MDLPSRVAPGLPRPGLPFGPRWACAVAATLVALAAQSAQTAPDADGPQVLGFRYLRTAGGEPVADVCCARPSRFADPAVEALIPGFGSGPVWIELPPLAAGGVLEVTRMVDEARLFERDDARGEWRISRAGDSVAPAGSALAEPGVAFALSGAGGAQRFLRVSQPTAISVNLLAWPARAYDAQVSRERVVRALLGGFVGAIVLYNLLVAIAARERVFALNAATIIGIATLDLYLSGYGVRYLWPHAASNAVFNVALAAVAFNASAFVRQFLGADVAQARRYRVLRGAGYAAPVVLATGLMLPYWATQLGLLVVLLAVIGLGFLATAAGARRGEPRARLLIVPFGLVIVPGSVLAFLQTIDASPIVTLREHALGATLALEALAFSLALAARIRMHAAEAERARGRLAEFEARAADRYSEFQDRERARISADLHDSVGHSLVMVTGALERIRGADEGEAARVDTARRLARETLREVRRLSHAIHPSTLEHLGWRDAVAALFAELQQFHDIEVHVDQPATEPALSARRRVDLYRVLQELVSNVAKHADATECRLNIREAGGMLVCEVSDDGVGLAGGGPDGSGLGLQSIEHRVRRLGGRWRMAASPGGGLAVRLEIPLDPA